MSKSTLVLNNYGAEYFKTEAEQTAVTDRLTANKFTLNKSKTEFMLIGSEQELCTLNRPLSLIIQ